MDDENSMHLSKPLESERLNDALTVQRVFTAVKKVRGFSVSDFLFLSLSQIQNFSSLFTGHFLESLR